MLRYRNGILVRDWKLALVFVGSWGSVEVEGDDLKMEYGEQRN
jgi:hypothetical protein